MVEPDSLQGQVICIVHALLRLNQFQWRQYYRLDQISHAIGGGGMAATTIRNDLATAEPMQC